MKNRTHPILAAASTLFCMLMAACSTMQPGEPHLAPGGQANAQQPVLRVCADPNNLPFSNAAGAGLENQLAQLVGDALGEKVEYTWWAQRRGFIRNTLKANKCDVVMGVPSDYGMTLNTHPYYRSGYVFLYRKDKDYDLHSITDPRLAKLKIGVHLTGGDNPPPAIALARRGIIDNVVGYSIYGDYRTPNPPAQLIDAVDHGNVDVAIAWGPLASYFAQRAAHELVLVPIAEQSVGPLPFRFSISMGVRHGDEALKNKLNAVLAQKRAEIDALLMRYQVPVIEETALAHAVPQSPKSSQLH